MGMSIWETNRNGNKCLAAMEMRMEMGLKLMEWDGMGKLRAIPAHL